MFKIVQLKFQNLQLSFQNFTTPIAKFTTIVPFDGSFNFAKGTFFQKPPLC